MSPKIKVAVNSLDKANWSNLPNMHSQREGGSAVAIPGNKILVVGGYHVEHKFLKSCAVLDLTIQQWSDYPPMRTARMGCAAVYLEQHNAVVAARAASTAAPSRTSRLTTLARSFADFLFSCSSRCCAAACWRRRSATRGGGDASGKIGRAHV